MKIQILSYTYCITKFPAIDSSRYRYAYPHYYPINFRMTVILGHYCTGTVNDLIIYKYGKTSCEQRKIICKPVLCYYNFFY